MSEIALYNLLKQIPDATYEAIKEAVADISSSKDVATKLDIVEVKTEVSAVKAEVNALKADVNAVKWLVGLLLAINIGFIASAIVLMTNFLN